MSVPGKHKTPATVAARLAAKLAAIALTSGSILPNASSHTPPSVSMPAEFASMATSAATVSQKEASRKVGLGAAAGEEADEVAAEGDMVAVVVK